MRISTMLREERPSNAQPSRFVARHFVHGVKKMYISDVLKGDYSLIEAFLKASFSSSNVKLPER